MITGALTKIIVSTLVILAIMLSAAPVFAAKAQDEVDEVCSGNTNSAFCQNSSDDPLKNILVDVINIMFYAVGALSVIYIIWGGFKYIKSNGESNNVAEAKKTIIYAIVGLVVAVIAPQIIAFALDFFG